MTNVLAQAAFWLSTAANALGRLLLAPVGFLPGWFSATACSAVTGILLLAAFKYTSNQRAIKRVRNDINANLLALKLFKESALVALKSQGRILLGALQLFVLAIVPVLVMVLPVTLVLAQLALWYQARPLRIGEDAVIALRLTGAPGSSWPALSLRPSDSVEVTAGPVRVQSKREACWNIRPKTSGSHRLEFQIGEQVHAKEIAVGEGFMRVSRLRPGWNWSSILLNPWEPPFRPGDPIQWIEIEYPERSDWTCGTDKWVFYWFIVSMLAALCFRRVLNVAV
jgi:hypothetical protein